MRWSPFARCGSLLWSQRRVWGEARADGTGALLGWDLDERADESCAMRKRQTPLEPTVRSPQSVDFGAARPHPPTSPRSQKTRNGPADSEWMHRIALVLVKFVARRSGTGTAHSHFVADERCRCARQGRGYSISSTMAKAAVCRRGTAPGGSRAHVADVGAGVLPQLRVQTGDCAAMWKVTQPAPRMPCTAHGSWLTCVCCDRALGSAD